MVLQNFSIRPSVDGEIQFSRHAAFGAEKLRRVFAPGNAFKGIVLVGEFMGWNYAVGKGGAIFMLLIVLGLLAACGAPSTPTSAPPPANTAAQDTPDACASFMAEVSAKLHIPLGVARVLLGDLVTAGHLKTRTTISENTTSDERRELIERTLSGLRAL